MEMETLEKGKDKTKPENRTQGERPKCRWSSEGGWTNNKEGRENRI